MTDKLEPTINGGLMKTMIIAVSLIMPLAAMAGDFDAYLPEPGPRVEVSVPRSMAVGEPAAPNPDLFDRLLKADDEVVRVQNLLGHYVIGATINGPILRREPIELVVDIGYQDLLAKFPFLRQTHVDGRIKVRLGDNVAGEYGQLRAEFMGKLPRLILLERIAGLGNDLSRGHMVWARRLQIVSQPECVDLAGRNPWPAFCS